MAHRGVSIMKGAQIVETASKRQPILTLAAAVAIAVASLMIGLAFASDAGAHETDTPHDHHNRQAAIDECSHQPEHRGDLVVVQSRDGDAWRCMPNIWFPVYADGETWCAPAAKPNYAAYCSAAAAHPDTFIQDGQVVLKRSHPNYRPPTRSNGFVAGRYGISDRGDTEPAPKPNPDVYPNMASFCNWHQTDSRC